MLVLSHRNGRILSVVAKRDRERAETAMVQAARSAENVLDGPDKADDIPHEVCVVIIKSQAGRVRTTGIYAHAVTREVRMEAGELHSTCHCPANCGFNKVPRLADGGRVLDVCRFYTVARQ